VRLADHVFRGTAQEHAIEAGPPVRAHHDQHGLLCVSHVDDTADRISRNLTHLEPQPVLLSAPSELLQIHLRFFVELLEIQSIDGVFKIEGHRGW
jgi:hypothetical protein